MFRDYNLAIILMFAVLDLCFCCSYTWLKTGKFLPLVSYRIVLHSPLCVCLVDPDGPVPAGVHYKCFILYHVILLTYPAVRVDPDRPVPGGVGV